MSWFGSRSTANSSRPEDSSNYVNKQKHKQIESLREQIPGVVEVKRDEQYSLTTSVNNMTLTLNIVLPVRFPLVAPEVSVSPPIQHPWVNSQMIVDGSPLLKNFTIHSKLGRGVDQVIREFHEHPPQLLSNPLPYPSMPGDSRLSTSSFSPATPQGFSPYSFSSTPQSSSFVGPPDSPENRPRRPAPSVSAGSSSNTIDGSIRYQCPPIPDIFEEIKQMSTEELGSHLNDSEGPVLVDEFVSKLDVIKKVQTDRDHLFQDTEDLAALNLGHEPEIQEDWTQLQEKFLEMEALKEEHRKRLIEQQQLIERYQQHSVVAQLKTLVNEADTQSEIYGDDFLDAKIPVAEFVQKYKQMRKLHHLRKTKYEKLTNHH